MMVVLHVLAVLDVLAVLAVIDVINHSIDCPALKYTGSAGPASSQTLTTTDRQTTDRLLLRLFWASTHIQDNIIIYKGRS